MKQRINEVKRFQKIAGILKEDAASNDIDSELFANMMKKYNRDLTSYSAEAMLDILKKAKVSGLTAQAINDFSALIRSAPKKKLKASSVGNKYTPVGQMTSPNSDYKSQLQAWKVDHVYPFFLAFGFDKPSIDAAWKELLTSKSWK